jgi:hypothetical protein
VAEQETKALMRAAVAEGIKEALTDEELVERFWDSAFKALSTRAQAGTGKFVLGGLAGSVKRFTLFLALGFVVYTLGGWTAIAKLWAVFWSN